MPMVIGKYRQPPLIHPGPIRYQLWGIFVRADVTFDRHHWPPHQREWLVHDALRNNRVHISGFALLGMQIIACLITGLCAEWHTACNLEGAYGVFPVLSGLTKSACPPELDNAGYNCLHICGFSYELRSLVPIDIIYALKCAVNYIFYGPSLSYQWLCNFVCCMNNLVSFLFRSDMVCVCKVHQELGRFVAEYRDAPAFLVGLLALTPVPGPILVSPPTQRYNTQSLDGDDYPDEAQLLSMEMSKPQEEKLQLHTARRDATGSVLSQNGGALLNIPSEYYYRAVVIFIINGILGSLYMNCIALPLVKRWIISL